MAPAPQNSQHHQQRLPPQREQTPAWLLQLGSLPELPATGKTLPAGSACCLPQHHLHLLLPPSKPAVLLLNAVACDYHVTQDLWQPECVVQLVQKALLGRWWRWGQRCATVQLTAPLQGSVSLPSSCPVQHPHAQARPCPSPHAERRSHSARAQTSRLDCRECWRSWGHG